MISSTFSESLPSEIVSVSQFNRQVRQCLEGHFGLTWIRGEISNLTYAASGHVYFTLKDANAQVRCALWRQKAQLLGWRLEQGQKVDLRGQANFYEPRGDFQITVETIRKTGVGNLFEQFLKLKEQLAREGLFDPETRRPLPAFPRRLAIITSAQGAALQDILHTLSRRAPYVGIDIFPSLVQGEQAPRQLIRALQAASAGSYDVIILARGGGSLEDLWAFNDEQLARAIRQIPCPVISGVGHETDFTIADFAADLRAPTPTAAAELAAPPASQWLAHLDQSRRQLSLHVHRHCQHHAQTLDTLALRLVHPKTRLQQQRDELQRARGRLAYALSRQFERRQTQLAQASHRLKTCSPSPSRLRQDLLTQQARLQRAVTWGFSRHHMKLKGLAASLNQLNPLAVLDRGYALVRRPDGEIIRTPQQLKAGDALALTWAKGQALATVETVVAPTEAE